NSFFAITISNNEYPDCDWVTSETNGSYTLTVNATADKLVDATYWSTTSSTRDFRNSIWEGVSLNAANQETITFENTYPQDGYRSFYIDLIYKDHNSREYIVSTRTFVTNSTEIL
ncbi:MAG: PhoPQ-activated pathogenicity-like protein PqaA type, partial [Bacteroidota bacterium]